jgi:molybdopterin synthase sulfur carrier subunit
MNVRVRLFASLREAVGQEQLELELEEGARVEAAWTALVGRHPALSPRRVSLMAAVNRRYADFDAALSNGDEVVFIPPVSGG